MNRPILLAAAIATIALIGAGSAFAVEGTQDFPDVHALSSASRADVQRAARDLAVPHDEASLAPQPGSALSREQVVAETHEALELGLIGSNAGAYRAPTPAQLDAIHTAGQHPASGTASQGAE